MSTRLPGVLALLAAASAGACGSEPASPPARPAAVDLVVETRDAPGPGRYAARCGGARCADEAARWRAWLEKASDDRRACIELYGGPERATVTGTLEGRAIDVTVGRHNGCAIADYEALFALLGRKPPVRPVR